MKEWGVTDPAVARGGLAAPVPARPSREVFLLQRKTSKPGAGLGKTTGWIHRSALKMKRVQMIAGVQYLGVDDRGLHILEAGQPRTLEVDSVILCTGQEPRRELEVPLRAAGIPVHLIGGADVAAELDAKRAIRQATLVAATL
jgi:2,4-dienoyl-CoA reductase (NADPH2)